MLYQQKNKIDPEGVYYLTDSSSKSRQTGDNLNQILEESSLDYSLYDRGDYINIVIFGPNDLIELKATRIA